MPAAVIQRDGQRAVFDACRIRSAIARAGAATGEFGDAQVGKRSDHPYDFAAVVTDRLYRFQTTAAGGDEIFDHYHFHPRTEFAFYQIFQSVILGSSAHVNEG